MIKLKCIENEKNWNVFSISRKVTDKATNEMNTTNNAGRNFLQVVNMTQEQATRLTEHQALEVVWRMTDEQIDEVLRNMMANAMREATQEIFEGNYRTEVAEEFYCVELLPEGYSIETDEDEAEMENFEARMWARFTLLNEARGWKKINTLRRKKKKKVSFFSIVIL